MPSPILRGLALSVAVTACPAQSGFAFDQLHRIPTIPRISSAVASDFDGDGADELVYAGGLEVRIVDGPGLERETVRTIVTPWPGMTIALGDVDADGDVDIYVSTRYPPFEHGMLRNDGSAGFSVVPFPRPNQGAIGARLLDLDGDSDLDLVRAGFRVDVFFNDSLGGFVQGWTADIYDEGRIMAADFDGDGDFELVAREHQQVREGHFVLDTLPGGGFSATLVSGRTDSRCVVGDFDGDGHQDIAITDGALLRLLSGDGNLGFSLSQRTIGPLWGYDLQAADVDLDGDLDIVTTSSLRTINLMLNDGSGHFVDGAVTRVQLPRVSFIDYVILGDFDGDRDPDVFSWGRTDLIPTPQNAFVSLNRHTHLEVVGPTTIGGQLQVELASRPGYLAVPQIGVAVIGVGRPGPLSTPWGMLHVDTSYFVTMPLAALAAPIGSVTIREPIPAAPALRGTILAVQAALVDLTTQLPTDLTAFDRITIR